jgi:pyruvate dehydrogenase E1 component beta subunit
MAELTYREALAQALREEMQRDEKVYIIGEDIGHYGGSYGVTRGFLKEFGPKRIIDAPIAEMGIAGLAIGGAMDGMRPVAEMMTINFAVLALDQMVNHAAKLHYMFGGQIDCPMVMRTVSGWGQLGATHSQSFENWFAHVPGLKVVVPATPADAKGMLKSAIRDKDPVVFIEHSLLYGVKGEVPDDPDFLLPLQGAQILREGKDITIVTYSRMSIMALRAAQKLSEIGIEAEIVDLRSLRPLDMSLAIESVQKTNHALIVTEDWRTYGTSAELSALLYEHAFDYLDAPIGRLSCLEVPMPYSKVLEALVIPDENKLVQSVREVLNR